MINDIDKKLSDAELRLNKIRNLYFHSMLKFMQVELPPDTKPEGPGSVRCEWNSGDLSNYNNLLICENELFFALKHTREINDEWIRR